MSTILLEVSLAGSELDQLRKEFPNYLFIVRNQEEIDKLSPEAWSHVEVIYGSSLTSEQLAYATELRWIYVPHKHVEELPQEEIRKRGNIIVTVAAEENGLQIGEFVMGLVLNFAKGISQWTQEPSSPKVWAEISKDEWHEKVWLLSKCIFLQIGLGEVGSEITKQARHLGLTVKGVRALPGFHPYCSEVFDYEHLSEALGKADIVCIYLPVDELLPNLLGLKELNAMKQNSVLIVIGFHKILNVKALIEVASTGKWRGLWLDLLDVEKLSARSQLWNVPGIVITPGIASLPKISSSHLFQLFHFNLRQYVVGNFLDMYYKVN